MHISALLWDEIWFLMLHLRLLFLPLMIYEEEEKETKLAHDLGVWKEAGLIPEIRPLSLAMGTRERGPSPIPQTLPPSFFPLPSSFFLSELRRPYVHTAIV